MDNCLIIEGTGTVGSFGNTTEALRQRFLKEHAQFFSSSAVEHIVSPADTTALLTYVAAKQLRQVDHYTRMALLSLFYALEDAGLSKQDLVHTGIILASGYGPMVRTFAFLDSIMDYGPHMASPLLFSLSVHNIPAATIAITLGLQGPYTTLCQHEGVVAQALLTAQLWLREGRVKRVLLVAVDEQDSHFSSLAAALQQEQPESTPYFLTPPLGEAAVCFSLSLQQSSVKNKGVIHSIQRVPLAPHTKTAPSVHPIWQPHDTMCTFLSGNTALVPHIPPSAFYVGHTYGNQPTGQALDILLALSALRGELSCVVPHDFVVCAEIGQQGMVHLFSVQGGQELPGTTETSGAQ